MIFVIRVDSVKKDEHFDLLFQDCKNSFFFNLEKSKLKVT